MIARTGLIAALLLTASVLQTSLLPALGMTGVRPDLLLLVVVTVALHDGALSGLRVGFAAGLLADLLVLQSPVGLATLVFTAVGFTIGSVRPYLASDSWTAPVLLAFVASLAGTLGYGLLALLLGEGRGTPLTLAEASLAVAIATTLVSPVVLWPVRRLLSRHPVRGAAVEDEG